MKLLTTGVRAFFTCCICVTLPSAGPAATRDAAISTELTSAVAVNGLRISDMGGTGDPSYGALPPAVAYNATNNQYLVAWAGDDNVGGLADDELEVFGQRLDAATGAEVGENDFRISEMGGTGDPDYDARWPAVSYASASNQLLVTWWADDNTGGLIDEKNEIFSESLRLPAVVADGFESGDTTAWSLTVP